MFHTDKCRAFLNGEVLSLSTGCADAEISGVTAFRQEMLDNYGLSDAFLHVE